MATDREKTLSFLNKQIAPTSKKVNPDYGLIISSDSLELNEELNTVKIPLRLFLLT